MSLILGQALALFAGGLVLHAIVWRVRRPASYRAWLPWLVVIFGPVATAVAWAVAPGPLELAAVLLLHYVLAAAYTIGYTLISAFSPSVEILKRIDRAGGRLAVGALDLPFLAGALTDERIRNLEGAGLVSVDGARLRLGSRGRLLTGLVLWYRHAVGLRDGGGG
ncbi:MAG: hypothetical protein Q8L86_16350 [Vicinamibacterales bacterium]|nr:hypothetical protein [Vicinamibacterales bacterium]